MRSVRIRAWHLDDQFAGALADLVDAAGFCGDPVGAAVGREVKERHAGVMRGGATAQRSCDGER